ncbi:MAG: hypothetical protein ACYCW6_00760 [Candidatus Xenobia bacterium]
MSAPRHCIGCGGQLTPHAAPFEEKKNDADSSVIMVMDHWFHDECPIERSFLHWRFCAACGGRLEGEGMRARCTGCSRSLPVLYQYCASEGRE